MPKKKNEIWNTSRLSRNTEQGYQEMRLAIAFSLLTTKQFDGIENIQKKC